MNELQVTAKMGAISFNYDDIKAEVQRIADDYASAVYTEDFLTQAKEDRARLNKVKAALNDERLKREREFMAPFMEFKAQVNDLIAIINEPIALIDEQVKAFEEQKKAAKRAEIEAYFTGLEKPAFLDLVQIWDPKWLNVSVSIKQVRGQIDAAVEKIMNDLATLEKLPQFSFEATEVYKTCLDINKAIAEGQRLADIQRRKEEQAKADANTQAQTEAPKEEPQQEPQADFIPSFEPVRGLLVQVPESKLIAIIEMLEYEGCIVKEVEP